mgnify:CR=1 FL=1
MILTPADPATTRSDLDTDTPTADTVAAYQDLLAAAAYLRPASPAALRPAARARARAALARLEPAPDVMAVVISALDAGLLRDAVAVQGPSALGPFRGRRETVTGQRIPTTAWDCLGASRSPGREVLHAMVATLIDLVGPPDDPAEIVDAAARARDTALLALVLDALDAPQQGIALARCALDRHPVSPEMIAFLAPRWHALPAAGVQAAAETALKSLVGAARSRVLLVCLKLGVTPGEGDTWQAWQRAMPRLFTGHARLRLAATLAGPADLLALDDAAAREMLTACAQDRPEEPAP